jgi:hypothetical protein
MTPQPRAIARLLQQVDHFLNRHDWDKAAGRCYQILALEPDHLDACAKLSAIYNQPELVNDMRRALAGLFDSDDASPHRQRRRLAFSYRVLSRWPGWLRDDEDQTPPVDDLEEAAQIINHAYLTGDDSDLLTAWEMYVQACAQRPECRYAVQWWAAKQYAAHGFFADAAEVLSEMLSAALGADADALYMLAEMRWWRDQAHTLTWVACPAVPR